MLKQKKNAIKLLPILLIISSLLGCYGLPTKEIITLCVIDYPAGEAICGETNKNFLPSTDVEEIIMWMDNPRREPLITLDKALAMRPVDAEKHMNYVQKLEEYAKACKK